MHIFLLCLLIPIVLCEVEIETATRTIDLTNHISNVKIEFKGITGDEKQFIIPIDKNFGDKLAHFSAECEGKLVDIKLSQEKFKNFTALSVTWPSKGSLTVKISIINAQVPKPTDVLQGEKQYAKFSANSFVLSPYTIKSQFTKVTLPVGQMLMYTAPEKPASKDNNVLKFGPYTATPAFSENMFSVVYEIKEPFLTITKMSRSIEVSHWGNIAVEEDIEIVNSGPSLKGSFSRFDYMHGIGHNQAAMFWNTLLPASAKDIYYRDLIGNVSTSAVKKLYSAVQLKIIPRFPLMGGWRTRYTIGYNVPAHEYLYRDGSKFLLKMRILDHVHKSQFVEEFLLKIVLPEAIENIKLELPFQMTRLPDTKIPTYLDTTGREVITLEATNLLEQHIQDFTINYDFSLVMMGREFGMVIGAFMAFFLAIIIYVRLDFSISKNAHEESSLRIQALVSTLGEEHEKRKSCYQRYDGSLNVYKVGKSVAKFSAECKALDAERETISQLVTSIRERMRALWSDGSEKLQELQDLDKKYRELFNNKIQLTESMVSSRIEKSDFHTQESELNTKIVNVVDKMNSIVTNL